MRIIHLKLIYILTLFNSIVCANEVDKKVISLNNVVVVGSVPGPDLWKVSNGENVLWILGTLSPLPKKIEWNSKPIEKVIQNSQALLLPPTLTADIGFFKAVSLARTALGVKKNPNKQKLKDLMSDELYARWLILKNIYMPKDKSIEKTRPIIASSKLYEKAIKKSGLKESDDVTKRVKRYSKKYHLEILTPKLVVELNEPKAALKKLKKTDISDLECFSKTLERLEVDLESMKSRAIAWSYGDIEQIKALPFADRNQACSSAFLDSQFAQDLGLEDIRTKLRELWLNEAKKSLKQNKSTFAILSISQLLNSDGILKDLQAQGYRIEEPKQEQEED
jgi:uncharacterized protein YbaP (TraB family)